MTDVSARFDMSDEVAAAEGFAAAAVAVHRGEVIVMPTDTVYGVAADAFKPEAVSRLLEVKGRGRQMPPPVLVSSVDTLGALTTDVPAWAMALVEQFWPGSLTLVCHEQGSLTWDLGETRGTVAVRMPDHAVALELLRRTGPLAVSSANLSGMPAASDADRAEEMLGQRVSVILDGGPTGEETPSTIVDCTGEAARILREGGVTSAEIRRVVEEAGGSLEDADA